MSKKKRLSRRTWVAKRQPSQEIWLEEDDDMRGYFAFIMKLHPEATIEETIQGLVDLGYLSTRVNAAGKREYRLNTKTLQAALDKLPPELKRHDLDLTVHESVAMICEYDNPMTMLLSVVIKQSEFEGTTPIPPWIVRTHEQLQRETFGDCPSLQDSFARLEAKHFVEVRENGPSRFCYRLNASAVQTAIDALPGRS